MVPHIISAYQYKHSYQAGTKEGKLNQLVVTINKASGNQQTRKPRLKLEKKEKVVGEEGRGKFEL